MLASKASAVPTCKAIKFLLAPTAVSDLALQPGPSGKVTSRLCPIEMDTLSLYRQRDSRHDLTLHGECGVIIDPGFETSGT